MTGRVHSPRQIAIIATLAACLTLTSWACGQDKPAVANTVRPNPPVFEVASVKPSKPGCAPVMHASAVGEFIARCMTIPGLVAYAYQIPLPSDLSIPGLPGWAFSAFFDLEAKPDDDMEAAMQKLPRKEQLKLTQQMLRALLAERFKLRVHHEFRERTIYKLVIAKSGFKLKNAAQSEPPKPFVLSLDYFKGTGNIKLLVVGLTTVLGRTVVDGTGLRGKYDFDIKWTPGEPHDTQDSGPTLFTALKEELGLKLVSAKGPVDTLVVDRVERPSEN